MIRSGSLLLCVAGLALVAAPAERVARAQQPQVIVEDVRVISVPVTVLDRRGRFIEGLTRDDFELFEDGAKQELSSFDLRQSEVSAMLLIDASGSMTSALPDAKRAALQFVRQLGPTDRVGVMQFDETPAVLGQFTTDKAAVEVAINRAAVGGATALYDALWTALAALEAERKRDPEAARRRVLVVLSDGDDSASAMTSEDVLRRARSTDTIVSALSLDEVGGRPAVNSNANIFLRQLSELSGGRLLFPGRTDLGRAFRDLADELRQQYVLGYVPSESAAATRYRRIVVNVKGRKDVALRHRQGYYTGQ